MADSDPETGEEFSRRRFMANASLSLGTVMVLGLAIPLLGSLAPDTRKGAASWGALDRAGWNALRKSTDGAVQIDFEFQGKDAYLPEQRVRQSVWGIRVDDPQKFVGARSDLFGAGGRRELPYEVVTMGFVVFSPLCPHLNCPYEYVPNVKRFVCHCHGSQYDRYGARISGPTSRGLDPLPLREMDGIAQVEWIRYKATTPDRLVVSYD